MSRAFTGLLLMMALPVAGLAIAATGITGADDGVTAYELVLFLHQLLFVYWIGPDIGVYYLSGQITNTALSVEQRLAAGQTMAAVDLVPRICLALMLTVGGILTEFVGVPHPTWQMVGLVLLGPVWLTMVLIIYFKRGTALGEQVTRLDFWFRWVLIVGIIASTTHSWITDRLADAPWVGAKLLLFAAILFFGLLMRIQVRPLMAGIGQLATAGPSDQLNASMAASLKRTKPFVIAMWICILWAALLGVIQPGG